MRNKRKGQSAMEYLMTYGWAILIVIIVGGVVWYYASQATTTSTAMKGGFSSVDVDSPWTLDSTGKLSLKAVNKVGKDITIDAVYVNGGTKVATTTPVSAGSTSGWIDLAGAYSSGNSGSSYKLDSVAIEYYIGTDTSRHFNSTGTLSGTRQ